LAPEQFPTLLPQQVRRYPLLLHSGGDDAANMDGEMKNRPKLVSDAQLERLASERGPASAEAYIVLELRETRSSGDHVAAFQVDGRYTVRSAPQ
jgi:hypothetical protein